MLCVIVKERDMFIELDTSLYTPFHHSRKNSLITPCTRCTFHATPQMAHGCESTSSAWLFPCRLRVTQLTKRRQMTQSNQMPKVPFRYRVIV